ncbi:MAG: SMC-Scp complex subunit ScpB [Oscillospiraceae bacterium]|nr:SMC-Scp complex subunit ScpB [Oscillospiraceae bacterium]MBQ9111593.1 SMC-Scp complex subunit ScpB [Oscillospiraceae bacterium]
MDEQNNLAAAEAILFAAGEPLETEKIALTLNILERDVQYLMDMLSAKYKETGSGLQVMHLGNAWQLGTRAEFAPLIRTALETKRMQPLSNAAMEALTIVAYNQPVSKGFVERVRGIDSSSVVNSLVDKGLLEEAGRIDVPGHPIAYRTTPLFLRTFGLSSLDDLPDPKPAQTEEFAGEIMDIDKAEE